MGKKGGGKGGMPGGMGDMMGMLQQAQRQAQQMQEKMAADLKDKTVEGTAGGGGVTAVVTGNLELRSVRIDASLMQDKEMLEDLVAAAVNVALKKAKDLQEQAQKGQLGEMLGGMGGKGGMPDLGALLGGMGM